MSFPYVIEREKPINTWDWQLDDATKRYELYNSKEEAQESLDKYLLELNKWLKINNLDIIDYWPTTPGVCMLEDLNRLMTQWRRTHNSDEKADILLMGTHELEQLRNIWCSNGYVLIPVPPVKRLKQRHLDAPFELLGMTCYPVKTFSCFRMLRL